MDILRDPGREAHLEYTIPSIDISSGSEGNSIKISGYSAEQYMNPAITVSTAPNSNNKRALPDDNSPVDEQDLTALVTKRPRGDERKSSLASSSKFSQISYTLRVKLGELSGPVNGVAQSYEGLESIADQLLKDKFPGVSRIQLRHGTCKVTTGGRAFSHSLASVEDLDQIMKLCENTFDDQITHLDVVRDYVALDSELTQTTSLFDQIQHQLHTLRRCGMNGQERCFYLLEDDLKTVLSAEIITSIVKQDVSMSILQEEKDEFLVRVKANPKLLAMAITTNLQMVHLKHFLDYHHITDSSLPKMGSFNCKCPQFTHNYHWFEKSRHDFIPPFFEPGKNYTFVGGTVLPMLFTPREDLSDTRWPYNCFQDIILKRGDREFKDIKKDAYLGGGTSSDVYRVRIDPNLHGLTENKDALFALKIFRIRTNPDKTKGAFEKEMDVLSHLRKYRHEHIVTHYVTWTQDDIYYMLFPYAECNLREFWAGYSMDVEKNALWFFDQLRGLSDALRNIHNFGFHIERRKSQTLTADAPPRDKMTGWHHDIKPENILYFERVRHGQGILKIADFGSGKVQTYREGGSSINTPNTSGTPPYEAPDYVFKGKISRPFDVWSLGCVFLEFLTWALLEVGCVDKFRAQRKGLRNGWLEDTGFWYLEKGAEETDVFLRKAVVNQIRILKERCAQSDSFLDVLDIIESKMLIIKPDLRITAVDLFNCLDGFYKAKQATRTDSRGNYQHESPSLRAIESSSPRPSNWNSRKLVIKVPDTIDDDGKDLRSPSSEASSEGHRRVFLTPSPVNGVIPVIFTSSPQSAGSEEMKIAKR